MERLSGMTCGITINNVPNYVCCAAVDLLLCSVTLSGLLKWADGVNNYTTKHDLSFNSPKTKLATFGKKPFHDRLWRMILWMRTTILHILVDFGKWFMPKYVLTLPLEHSMDYRGLLCFVCCMSCAKPSPTILVYGLQCVYENKTAMQNM